MKCNVGSADRILRISLAAVLVVLIAIGIVKGTLAIVFGILAAIFFLTGIVRFCPLYIPFKIDTNKK